MANAVVAPRNQFAEERQDDARAGSHPERAGMIQSAGHAIVHRRSVKI